MQAKPGSEWTFSPTAPLGHRPDALHTAALPFYREKLGVHGIDTLVPEDEAARDFIQTTLRDELGRGIALASTRKTYLGIIDRLIDRGTESIVFGCTELPLLGASDVAVPVFDTTRIHVRAAVDFALSAGEP